MARVLNLQWLLVTPDLVNVLDTLNLTTDSHQLLNQGFTPWMFPARSAADTDTTNSTLHTWEKVLVGTNNTPTAKLKKVLGTFK
eukprot:15354710-Ditylum_brightwellii.AAC.1